MKVLIVNTSETTGGAAVAARRLTSALNNNGVKAKMLVRDKASHGADDGHPQTFNPTTVECGNRLTGLWHFLWERIVIYLHMHLKYARVFQVDIANSGFDITRLPEFKEADVVHLHWVNQGMLSLKGIKKILKSGKPVVWTMHDQWPSTAICHYARNCRRYTNHCGRCPLLPGNGSDNDLSARVWRQKQQLLQTGSITFVTCSRWLEGEAKRSALLRNQTVTSIPNAIDTRTFCPHDRMEARRSLGLPVEGHVILFVSQRVTDERKGISYFIEALRHFAEQQPQTASQTTVAILGGHADEIVDLLPLPAHQLGYVSDEQTIVNVYSAADVYVTPSLEDNLPNTLMEAMACGVPCVGFRVGGIPEMIDHQRNGFLADPRDSETLAKGIGWVLGEADREELRRDALRKVAHNYSQTSVSMHYIEVYQQAIAEQQFNIR